MEREKLAKKIAILKAKGKKIVFTNGVFDLMHVGHVRLLRKAASHGDILVVGMNSDASVKAIKGPQRPIVQQQYRAEVLCALSFVDYVVIFDERTPQETIRILKPDIHVKGGDWDTEKLPETPLVRSYGGKVIIENSQCEITTTSLIKRILEVYPKK